MPLFDMNGTQITKYGISDGDSFSYTNANGEYISRVRLDYNTGETLNNTEMDSNGNITYNDNVDMKKSKEIQKLTSILKGQSAFDNYKQNANQAKEVLDQIVKKYNVKVVGKGTGESSLGKYETANLVVDVNGTQVPLSSIMKNVGLGYSVDKNGVISGKEYLSEIQNGVTDAQSKLAKIDEMFKTGKTETRTEFSYASGMPTSTLITRDMLKERETVNNNYIKYGEQFIPQLSDRLRKMDNIPGGEAILFKMKQNPIGYGYSSLGELEADIKKDPIQTITKGLVYGQAAYASTVAADAFNVTGGQNRSAADLAYLEGLAVLGSGSKDAVAGFVDSMTTFSKDGTVGTHNRKTHLDRNSFGNQLMNEKAGQGKLSWSVDRFFDGAANGTLIGNAMKYVGLGDNASLNESIMRDVMASDSNGFLMSASNIAGNIVGMITEAAVLRKGASGLKGMKASSVMQASNTSQALQYGLHGTVLPMTQAINEAEENPLWEQYIDKGWKESDFTKVIADGVQNVATMYVGNKVLEPIFGTMMRGQWLKKAMMVGKQLPASTDEKIAKNLLNNIFANHIKFPATAFAIDVAGDMGLDYASVKLANNIAGYDGVEESIFTKSTTASLGDMFSEDMLARTLAQRFGARVFKNISSSLTQDVLQKAGKVSDDELYMGEVKWYERERAKYSGEDGTKRGMSASEKFTVWMSNAMFGNSLKQLDLSSRYLDKGFLDEAKAMDTSVDKSHIETQMNTTLLRWMIQENTLNVASKLFYGNLVDGAKNKFLSTKYEDKVSGEVFDIKKLYNIYRAGYSEDRAGVNSKLEVIVGNVNKAVHNYSIDSNDLKKFNSDDPDNIKFTENIVSKILETEDAVDARIGTRILFSNLTPKGMTVAKGAFDRVIANKSQELSLDIEKLKSQRKVTPVTDTAKIADLDTKINSMEESVKKLKGVVETIKNPNAAEDYSKDFKQISEEFFRRTGLGKGASITEDEAETVINNLSKVLGPKENDMLWKMGLGNGLNSDEFKKVFIALREAYKGILADSGKSSKQKLDALFNDFGRHSSSILKTAFNTLRDEIKSASKKSNATDKEKANAINTLNSLKMLVNLTPFNLRGEFATDIRSLVQDQDVFNLIVSHKIKGEIDSSSDRDKYVADMKDGLISEILESATVLGSLREFMSVDTAAGKMETRAEIARMYNSEDPRDRAKATRLVKAYDEPVNNVNDNIKVIGKDKFEFPNLFDLVNISAKNTGWREIADNALIATAISKFEKIHYDEDKASDTIELSAGKVTINRDLVDGKNNYEIVVENNILKKNSNENNALFIATSIAKACINEYSGMNNKAHTNHTSFFSNDEIKPTALNGKTSDDIIDDINKTFSTIDILGVTRILYSLLDKDGAVAKIKSEYVVPALSLMRGFNDAQADIIAKTIVDRAMAYRSKTVNIGIDANGKILRASLSPVPTANTFTSVKAKHGFYGYMTSLEFPDGTDEATKDGLIKKYMKDNHALSAGVFGNNLNTTIIQFSHDLNVDETFRSLFTEDYDKSVFKDYVNALNTSNNNLDSKNTQLLKVAYESVMKSNPKSFLDFSDQFSKEYGTLLKAYVSKIVDDKPAPSEKKKPETETDYRKQIDRSSIDLYFSSMKDVIKKLITEIDVKLPVFSDNSIESSKKSGELIAIKTRLEGYLNKVAINESASKSLSNEDVVKFKPGNDLKGIIGYIIEESNKLEKIDPISFVNINGSIESINESDFYNRIRKDISNDVRPTFKKSSTVEELARDNIELINKTMSDTTLDKQELFVRTMMAGSASYLSDYYSKRQSYHITAQVDPKVMAKHLLEGTKKDRKVMAIWAKTDADGNQVFPKDMIDALALMGDAAAGKLTAGMSKNQMYTSKYLSTDQLIELINIAGIDNVKALLGSSETDIVKLSTELWNNIKNNTFDFVVLTPQSFKGMNIEILKSMKQSMKSDSGMIFSGTRSELFKPDANGGFEHGLARGILDTATHAYNKTNADEKEASSQLDASLQGRLYLSQYLAKYDDNHVKNILRKDQGLVDISTMFENVQRDILKQATIDKKVIGLTGSAIAFDLDKNHGDFILDAGAEYNKLKIPSTAIGTIDLGLLILQIKDIKKSEVAKALGTKLANGGIATNDDIASALNILVTAKVMTEFKNEDGSKAYSMVAVRYPIVGGTNFTAVKIKGFKNGQKGVAIQIGPYKELLGGDWDGDTVQLLEVDMKYFESLQKEHGTKDVYGALETDIVEMTASARLSKISAKIESDDSISDVGGIGGVLSTVQNTKKLLPSIAKMHNSRKISNIINSAIFNAFNIKVDVAFTKELKTGEMAEEYFMKDRKSDISTDARYLEDQSRFVMFVEGKGGFNPVGSLGGVKFGDNDLVVIKESGINRIYKRGEVYFTTIDDDTAPGFKRIIAASRDEAKVFTKDASNFDKIDAKERFDQSLMFMKDAKITSLDTIDRFWDGSSTSRVKLMAIMRSLRMDEEGANTLERLVEIQAANAISINFKSGETVVNNQKFDVYESNISKLNEAVLEVTKHMNEGGDGNITISDMKMLLKLTGRKLPTGEDLTKLMEVVDRVVSRENYVLNTNLPASIKGILDVMHKYKYNNMDNPAYNIIHRLKENGRLAENFDIGLRDFSDNNGPKFNMVKAAHLIDNMIKGFGIRDVVSTGKSEKAFLSQTADLIASKDAYIKADHGVFIDDVSRILERDYKGQIKPDAVRLAKDVLDVLRLAKIEFATKTMLDVKNSDPRRQDIAQAEMLDNFLNGIAGDRATFFVEVGSKTKQNIGVVDLTNRLTAVMLDKDTSEIDKAIVNGILNSLDNSSQAIVGMMAKGITPDFIRKVVSGNGNGNNRLVITEKMMESYKPIPVLETDDIVKTNNILNGGTCQ